MEGTVKTFILAITAFVMSLTIAHAQDISCANYAAVGKLKHAAACYTWKIKQNPKNTLAYFRRARVHMAAGKHKDAIADFIIVTKRVPWPKAFGGAAWAYYKGGHPQKGLSYAERAVQLNPEDQYTWHTLGKIAEAIGDIPKAAAAYRKAWRLDPEHQKGFFELDAVHGLLLCCRG